MPPLPDFIDNFDSRHGWSEVVFCSEKLLKHRFHAWIDEDPGLLGVDLSLKNVISAKYQSAIAVGSLQVKPAVCWQEAKDSPYVLTLYGSDDIEYAKRLANTIETELEWLVHLQARVAAAHVYDRTPVIMFHAAEIAGRWVLTSANQTLLNFLGVPAETLIGEHARQLMTDFVHPEDLPKLVVAYDFARTTSREATVQYRLRNSDGDYATVVERVVFAPAKGVRTCVSSIWMADEEIKTSESQRKIIESIEQFTQDITLETGQSFLDHFCRRLMASGEIQSLALVAHTENQWWETWTIVQNNHPMPDFHFKALHDNVLSIAEWNKPADQIEDLFLHEHLNGQNAFISTCPVSSDADLIDVSLLIGSDEPIHNHISIVRTLDQFGVRLVREIEQLRIVQAQENQNRLLEEQNQQLTHMVTMLGELDTAADEHSFLLTAERHFRSRFDVHCVDWLIWDSGEWQILNSLPDHETGHWFDDTQTIRKEHWLRYLEECRRKGRVTYYRGRMRVFWPIGLTEAGFLVVVLTFRAAIPGRDFLEFSQNAMQLALQGLVQRENLRYQAMRDSLTGLGNRIQLHAWIKVALPTQQEASLLLFDLNRFKEINDSFGHQFGDKLLMEIGPRITESLVDKPHYLARLGGDEFALFFPNTSPKEAIDLAKRLHDKLAESYLIDGLRFQVEASVGVAHYPQHGKDGHELLRCSDVAMYAAKNSNRKVVVFDAGLDTSTPLRIAVLSELDQALRDEQLWVAYQPLMSTETGLTGGFEALVRWTHPEFGPLSPAEFIPIAEMGEGIRKITDFVLRKTLVYIKEWQKLRPDLHVAVNISPRVLLDHMFPQNIQQLLKEYELPGEVIVMELTESTLLVDPVRAVEIIHALAELGIKVEIDDFGTGYSSLAYLRSLPISALKIDRSFVTDILENTQDEVIVQSTVQMAHSLGLQTIAEGVEDEATLLKMMRLGCDMIQGYYYSKPLPGPEISDWLTRNAI